MKWFLTALLCLSVQAGPSYQPTAESLRTHPVPRWFEDAKFGVSYTGVPTPCPLSTSVRGLDEPQGELRFLLGGPPFTPARGNLPDRVFNALIQLHRYARKRGSTLGELGP